MSNESITPADVAAGKPSPTATVLRNAAALLRVGMMLSPEVAEHHGAEAEALAKRADAMASDFDALYREIYVLGEAMKLTHAMQQHPAGGTNHGHGPGCICGGALS